MRYDLIRDNCSFQENKALFLLYFFYDFILLKEKKHKVLLIIIETPAWILKQ